MSYTACKIIESVKIFKGFHITRYVSGGTVMKEWAGRGPLEIEPNNKQKSRPAIVINMLVTKRDESVFTREDVESFLESYVDYMDLKEFDGQGECYRAEDGNNNHWGIRRSYLV